MINPSVHAEILARLEAAEREHGVRVLYACESGSRAWGFASPDSDYDVRFLYAHPPEWYLSFEVERKRDVIEYPIVDELDCAGWDVRKALHLFSRTNGALLEWLKSPIRYRESGPLAEGLRHLAPRAANRVALCYHYSHMARANTRSYLLDDEVRLKKYFYVLRPLLAIRYIEARDEPPPIEFGVLVDTVAPDALKPAIADLLELKARSTELGVGPRIPELNAFIESETARHGEGFSGPARPDMLGGAAMRAELDALFRRAIGA